MKLSYFFSVVLLLLMFQAKAIYAEELTIYTEEFPPFNFTENGKVIGVSTEIVEAVMKRSGLKYKIESYPWPRTLKYVENKDNSLIYSISRRAKREDYFKWIGIVAPSVQSVFTTKDRSEIEIVTLEDLKNIK